QRAGTIPALRRNLCVCRAGLSSCARQGMHPTMHAAFGILNIFVREPFLEIDSIDWINGAHEVALVAEWYGGVDAHAAFEARVRRRPFLFAGGHTLGRHESLPAAARQRIDDVGLGIDPSGETPHDVVHVVRIAILADG